MSEITGHEYPYKFILSGRGGNASGYPLDDDNFVVVAEVKFPRT